jgi:hypothetical protein
VSVAQTLRATPRTSPAKPNIKYLRQGAHGPEPYNKYTRPCAQEGGPAAYLCTYLDNHGVKPEKVLKKAGLAGADLDDPASVNALYLASTSNSGLTQFAVTVMPMPIPTLMTMPPALPM